MSVISPHIAKGSSGARLSGKQYREWYAKVKRHDKLERAVRSFINDIESMYPDEQLLCGPDSEAFVSLVELRRILNPQPQKEQP